MAAIRPTLQDMVDVMTRPAAILQLRLANERLLEPIAADIDLPRLTLVLEASFSCCQSRIANKSGTARELDELTATSAFHERERQFYRWLGRKAPNIFFVDAATAADEVVESALALLRSHLPDIP